MDNDFFFEVELEDGHLRVERNGRRIWVFAPGAPPLDLSIQQSKALSVALEKMAESMSPEAQ